MAVLVKAPERIRDDLRRHRPALPGARWSPTASRRRSSPSTRNAACSTRPQLDKLPAAGSQRDRHVGHRQGAKTSTRPYNRDRDDEEKLLDRFRDPDDPLQDADRHRQAADRLRRADPAGDVPRQAAARPHAAAGHLPRQPHLRRAEDPRPDRGLPRHLRRRGQGAGVRRARASRQVVIEHPGAEGQAARGHAEVPGLLPRRATAPCRATRA